MNEKLQEILELITESYSDKSLSKDDLNEIIFHTSKINRFNLNRIVLRNYFYKNNEEPIDPEIAKNAVELFNNKFIRANLNNKVFKIDFNFISNIFFANTNLVIHLAENEQGDFHLAFTDGQDFYEVDVNGSSKIRKDRFDAIIDIYLKNRNGIKKIFDNDIPNSNGGNTQYVTIPYKTNFDQINANKPDFIVLKPASVIYKNEDRVSFIMYFEKSNGDIITYDQINNYSNYDTFTPFP